MVLDPSSIIVWNSNGAASREFLRTEKEIIRTNKPTIFGLFEIKVSGVKADSICRKLGFDEWIRVEALGYSGGIWVFWNECMKVEIFSVKEGYGPD